MSTERTVIAGLIAHLQAAGFPLVYVWDGEERVKVKTAAQALEVCFSVDDSRLVFGDAAEQQRHAGDASRYGVLIVLGNAPDGSEVIADHSAVEPFAGHIDAYCRAKGFYG